MTSPSPSSLIPLLLLLTFPFASFGALSQNDAIIECQNRMLRFLKSNDQLKSRSLPPSILRSEEIKLFEKCSDASDCYDALSSAFPDSPDINGMTRAVKFLLDPKCDLLRFNSGEFLECAENINLKTENMKQLISEPGFESIECQLTEREFSNLSRLVKNKCGERALEDLKINENIVKEILCMKNNA